MIMIDDTGSTAGDNDDEIVTFEKGGVGDLFQRDHCLPRINGKKPGKILW